MNETRFGNIVFIPGRNSGRSPFCNSLFIDDKIKAVVDPASDKNFLIKIGENPGVDVIVNTHYHEDHIRYNYLFQKAKLWVPEFDAPCFKSVKNFFDYWGVLGSPLETAFQQRLEWFHYQERIPDREFSNGEILDFGETKFTVIHTPGHTGGHSCLYCKEQELLFIADIDMSSFGPWYGDKFSDIEKTIQSARKILDIPAKIFITSHEAGILYGDIRESVEKYLQIIDKREKAILDYLQKERTLDELVSQWIIYKKPREPLFFYEFSEKSMLKKHLEYSILKGQIKQNGDKYVAV